MVRRLKREGEIEGDLEEINFGSYVTTGFAASVHHNIMAGPTILVIDNDRETSRLVRKDLKAAHFSVRIFSNGDQLLWEAERRRPDLFILDVIIPGGDGFELCRAIRHSRSLKPIPIIFLTARTMESDRVRALNAGADDYLLKPFSSRELVARIKAVLRRSCGTVHPTSRIRIGDLEIDPLSRILTVRGNQRATTPTEFRMLDFLARNVGRVLTRDQLLHSVWRDGIHVTPRSVDIYVGRVREIIELNPENPLYLKTVRGVGYRLDLQRS